MLEEWLPGQLGSEPDLTLEEHCGAFEEALRAKVSTATMSRRISRLPGGWPLKNQGSHGARRGGRQIGQVTKFGSVARTIGFCQIAQI